MVAQKTLFTCKEKVVFKKNTLRKRVRYQNALRKSYYVNAHIVYCATICYKYHGRRTSGGFGPY